MRREESKLKIMRATWTTRLAEGEKKEHIHIHIIACKEHFEQAGIFAALHGVMYRICPHTIWLCVFCTGHGFR